MKKILSLLVAAVLYLSAAAQDEVTGNANASPSAGSTMLLGFRYMPTLTSVDVRSSGGDLVQSTFILGNGFGGLLGVAMGDNAALQAEVIYSSLAQKYRDGSLDHEIKLSYINVPLMLVLNTGYSKPVNLNIALGPQFGFNTASSITGTGSGSAGDTVHAVLAVKPADIGFAYGAGLDFGLGTALKLTLGYRGVIGLIDISDKSKSITTNEYYVLDRSHVKTYAGYIGLTFGF